MFYSLVDDELGKQHRSGLAHRHAAPGHIIGLDGLSAAGKGGDAVEELPDHGGHHRSAQPLSGPGFPGCQMQTAALQRPVDEHAAGSCRQPALVSAGEGGKDLLRAVSQERSRNTAHCHQDNDEYSPAVTFSGRGQVFLLPAGRQIRRDGQDFFHGFLLPGV